MRHVKLWSVSTSICASLTLCAMAYGQTPDNVPAPSTSPAAALGATTLPVNMTREDSYNLRQSLAEAINNACTGDSFETLASMFTRSGHDRLVAENPDTKKWQAATQQFRADWKAKYHADFDLTQAPTDKTVLGIAKVKTAEDPGTARLAGAQQPATTTGASSPASDIAQQISNDRITVTYPSQTAPTVEEHTAGAPAHDIARDVSSETDNTTLQMLRAGGTWRVMLPEKVDAKSLLDDLAREVSALDQNKNNWPKDQTEAYKLVADHVLSVIAHAGLSNPAGK